MHGEWQSKQCKCKRKEVIAQLTFTCSKSTIKIPKKVCNINLTITAPERRQ